MTTSPEHNPYQAPAAEVDGHPVGQAAVVGQPTPRMIQHLRQTGPWVLFLAVLGFISCAFTLLGSLSMLVVVPFMGSVSGSMNEGLGFVIGMALFYLLYGAMTAAISYYLVRFSQGIFKVGRTRSMGDMEAALGAQQLFWKMSGIMTIAMVVLTILFFVGLVAYSVSLASGMAANGL